jgi:hypothetical protein
MMHNTRHGGGHYLGLRENGCSVVSSNSALSTLWFLFVLGFTLYMRFNRVWGLGIKVKVGANQNMDIVRWLITTLDLFVPFSRVLHHVNSVHIWRDLWALV